jgi:hypothetical protein
MLKRLSGICPIVIVIGAYLLVAGCVIARDVQLYPDNDAAHTLGPLHARIVGHGNLNGTATMSLPDGQHLQGRYSISHGGSMSVGSVYASVYRPGGSASGSGVQTSMSFAGQGYGEADMMSPQGATAHCEFLNDNFNGHGHGACRLSDGSLYRMQY